MKTKALDLLAGKSSDIISIHSSETIHEAIKKLVTHNIGALLVVDDDDKLVGIFTERDILKESSRRSDQIKNTKVESAMTTDLIIGLPEDDVEYLMGIMTSNKIRHIPIMVGEEIKGIISIGDLVKAVLTHVNNENRYLKDYIMGKYPA
ncbi:CBS domain-containing protein [candidate division KSB1 bacterium]|nr:CBS domain-containing protein [candidate division KSB1 bacterium]